MIKKKYIKFSIILSLSFGVVFSLFSIVFYFGDWIRALIVFFWGIFVGALAIPEIEKKAVKKPILFQSIIGAIGGCFAALAFTNNFTYIFYSILIGFFVGLTAHFWLEHVPIP